MRIISLKMVCDFSSLNPAAVSPLGGWCKTIEQNQFACWADLKRSLNSVDNVDDLTVFNVGGNKYRLIGMRGKPRPSDLVAQ